MYVGEHRPTLRTRVTGRLNAVIWALPLPNRVVRLASLVVYRNPPMPRERMIETIDALERAGVENVLAGGWGIDALHGRQLRTHHDIDLLIETADLPRARTALAEIGYETWHSDASADAIGHLPISWAEALRDGAMRVVELHGVELADLALTDGSITGRPVRCMEAEVQLESHRVKDGVDWTRRRRVRRRRNLEALELAVARSSRETGLDVPSA